MSQSEIFDRRARRMVQDRAARSPQEDRWIIGQMSEEMAFRLTSVRRRFERALIIGVPDACLAAALSERSISYVCAGPGSAGSNVVCDEDRMPFRDDAFDLVIAINTLDTVNDLPGAFILARRMLEPGGLFLAAFAGANSLPWLKQMFRKIDPSVSRLHPAIDVRAAGDLLGRAGFFMPVADIDVVTARYKTVSNLIIDIRANALSNVLITRKPMSRATYKATISANDAQPYEENFNLLYLTGWSPER